MSLILWSLLLALNTACAEEPAVTTPPSEIKVDVLAIWRAPKTAISNRLAAAKELLSVGMNTRRVESILGAPDRRNRHNPGHARRIKWRHDYRFPDGTISVHFLQVMDASSYDAEYQSVSISGETSARSTPVYYSPWFAPEP